MGSTDQMDEGELTVEQVEREEHKVERSSHAIYGLIIITATLVAERAVAEDALTSLVVTLGAGVVLVLAHVYSATVAEVGEKGRWLTHAERHVLIADNVPTLLALVVPTLLIIAAGIGLLDLALALDLAVLISIGALFAVGVYQARLQGASRLVQLGLGLLGGAIGVLVVAMEVYLAH